jgi:hypothetical protein
MGMLTAPFMRGAGSPAWMSFVSIRLKVLAMTSVSSFKLLFEMNTYAIKKIHRILLSAIYSMVGGKSNDGLTNALTGRIAQKKGRTKIIGPE